MILFGKIIIAIGLVLFPIIKSIYKGAIELTWIQGFLMGGNYDGTFFAAKINGEEEARVFKLHTLQLHLGLLTLSFAWSIEHPDKEIDTE